MSDSLGLTLKKARRLRNLTQIEAAKAIGISHQSLKKFETGGVPTAKMYEKLAFWLGTPVEAITPLEIKGTYYKTKAYKKSHRPKRTKVLRKKLSKEAEEDSRKKLSRYAKKYRKWMPKEQWLEMMRPKWEKMRKRKYSSLTKKLSKGEALTQKQFDFLKEMEKTLES